MRDSAGATERWIAPMAFGLSLGLSIAAGYAQAPAAEPQAAASVAVPAPVTTQEPAPLPVATAAIQPAQATAPTPGAEPATAPPSPPVEASPQPAAVPAPAAPILPELQATAPPPAVEAAIGLVLAQLNSAPATPRTAAQEDRAALAAFYAGNGGTPLWTVPGGYAARGTSALAELRKADGYGLDAQALAIPAGDTFAATPEAQAEAELKTGLAVLAYARHARGGRVDPSNISRLIDMRPTLLTPKAVLETIAASDDAGSALRGFHPQHPGFKRLQAALIAARATTTSPDTLQRILVNMERWRWMPVDMGAFYVWDNVPEQLTRVVQADQTVLTEKIVVGKPSTPTPQFTANMQYVIFHPSWGVPEGIKNNEVGPMLRRASANGGGWFFGDNNGAGAALARHNLQVMHNGRVVNPDNIDWTTVDVRAFQFTQPPSGRNVLGVVKFRFPNRHDVYMHDTPERHLFNSGLRAFSHGCMRVQNPMHLAEVVLAYDKGWSKEKVNGFVGRGSTADITLDKPVPVHITYFTASADESGKLHQHGDVYGMDQRVASALSGKAVHLAAVKAPVDAVEVPARRTAATRVPTRAARAQSAQPYFPNPFSGLFSN